MLWGGGTITGTGSLFVNSNTRLEIDGPVTLGRTLKISDPAGMVSMKAQAAKMTLVNSASIVNWGTFFIATPANILVTGNPGTFINQFGATLNVYAQFRGRVTTSTIALNFVNEGGLLWISNNTTLVFTGSSKQQSGNTDIDEGSTLDLGGSTYTIVGGSVTGAGGGNATIKGSLVVNNGNVQPGNDETGTLTVTGNYTQTGGTITIWKRLNGNSKLIVGNNGSAGVVQLRGTQLSLNAPAGSSKIGTSFAIIEYEVIRGLHECTWTY
jgi:hypothetical protein